MNFICIDSFPENMNLHKHSRCNCNQSRRSPMKVKISYIKPYYVILSFLSIECYTVRRNDEATCEKPVKIYGDVNELSHK